MPSTNTNSSRRWRMSYVMLGTSLIAVVIAYGAATFLEVRRWREQAPQLAANSLIKALRAHQRQIGRFPGNFLELEATIWKHKVPPDFGADGCSLSRANYFYIYHLVDARTASIWIIPTGPRREESATHFLLLYPESLRRWKGPPLSLPEIAKLRGVPQYGEMTLLGMTEQQPIETAKRK